MEILEITGEERRKEDERNLKEEFKDLQLLQCSQVEGFLPSGRGRLPDYVSASLAVAQLHNGKYIR